MKRMKTIAHSHVLEKLKAGSVVLLSGTIYTARDQAHKRLVEALRNKRRLPIDLRGAILYYCGPTGTPRGKIIGSCGPTTSGRMDAFTPALLQAGLKGMIGKGNRNEDVLAAIRKYKAVYFLTYAGCGALLSRYVTKKTLVAYPDLGPEAMYQLTVKDFPLIVGIDARGWSIYK
ncbi:MAG: fumarate hydratase C-terminal domain-containing protein [Candidatus Omnitrophica bacterium]|nr:fumarate hydratase C-terminal domain-containing protein [Candidatus Omnitrophota bacterium]